MTFGQNFRGRELAMWHLVSAFWETEADLAYTRAAKKPVWLEWMSYGVRGGCRRPDQEDFIGNIWPTLKSKSLSDGKYGELMILIIRLSLYTQFWGRSFTYRIVFGLYGRLAR